MGATMKTRVQRVVTEEWAQRSGPTLAQIERFVEDCKKIGVPGSHVLFVRAPDPLRSDGWERQAQPMIQAVLVEELTEEL